MLTSETCEQCAHQPAVLCRTCARELAMTVPLQERVIGMLMHLWSLVPDTETRRVISETIDSLNKAEE